MLAYPNQLASNLGNANVLSKGIWTPSLESPKDIIVRRLSNTSLIPPLSPLNKLESTHFLNYIILQIVTTSRFIPISFFSRNVFTSRRFTCHQALTHISKPNLNLRSLLITHFFLHPVMIGAASCWNPTEFGGAFCRRYRVYRD